MPPWLISLLLHAICLILLAFLLGKAIPVAVRGVTADRTAEVGIELKSRNDGKTFYRGAEDLQSETAAEQASGAQAQTSDSVPSLESLADSQTLDVNPESALPSAGLGISAADLSGGSVGAVGDVLSGASGASMGELLDGAGKGTARCFGTSGKGRKFVYVFDRSASMGGGARSTLAFAKKELLNSIQSLSSLQQFQVIFYNETPTVFSADGLALGDERNKELAKRFLSTIFADGGTDHVAALKKAIQCRPDVIFFLTDADEPRLSAGQLDTIRRLAASTGIQINAIEFGMGPKQGNVSNFIQRLAEQNSGQYIYIDITNL